MTKAASILLFSALLGIGSCQNREVNPEIGPNFTDIHEDHEYHFDRIIIDGYEYLILERDRNNPHEGFGFMSLTGAPIGSNQDTIKAYLKTLMEVQAEILSKLNKEPKSISADYIEQIMQTHLGKIPKSTTGEGTKKAAE